MAYFVARHRTAQVQDGRRNDQFGTEPWFTDGTAAGTRRIIDINIGPSSSAGFGTPILSNGSWFFAAQDQFQQIWTTDGSSASIVSEPGARTWDLLSAHQGRVYYTAPDSDAGADRLQSTDASGNVLDIATLPAPLGAGASCFASTSFGAFFTASESHLKESHT